MNNNQQYVFHQKMLTKEQKQYIISNYPCQNTYKIAEYLNLSYSQVRHYAYGKNIKKSFDGELIHKFYFDTCLNKVKTSKKLNNIKEPKISNDLLYKSKFGKYYINQNYFEEINNEFKAYWLGFLYADGCNRIITNAKKKTFQVDIGLQYKDEQHLVKFLTSIQADYPIVNYTNKEGYKRSRIVICNQKFSEDLNKLGCVPNKSLILKFPTIDIVPQHLIRHFIRGYFDGDGCIFVDTQNKRVSVSLLGTKQFITDFQQVVCNELNIAYTKIQHKKDTQIYHVAWGDVRSCELLYKYMYSDCNIYLDRKLEKFNTLYCLD